MLSILSLGCLVLGATGIAGQLSLGLFALGLAFGMVVAVMTCERLRLRLPGELQFCLFIPIMAILAAVLFPLLSYMRDHDRQSSCAASMRMIGVAMEAYCDDWDGKLPPPDRWNEMILKEKMRNFRDFCPSAPGGLPTYAMNGRLGGLRLKGLPKDTVLLFECTPGRNRSGGPELLPPEDMHPSGINVLFADGSVRCMHVSRIRDLRW